MSLSRLASFPLKITTVHRQDTMEKNLKTRGEAKAPQHLRDQHRQHYKGKRRLQLTALPQASTAPLERCAEPSPPPVGKAPALSVPLWGSQGGLWGSTSDNLTMTGEGEVHATTDFLPAVSKE